MMDDVKKAYEVCKDAIWKVENYKGEIDEYAQHIIKMMKENLKLWQHVEEDLVEEAKEEELINFSLSSFTQQYHCSHFNKWINYP